MFDKVVSLLLLVIALHSSSALRVPSAARLIRKSVGPVIAASFALSGYEGVLTQGFTNPSPMVAVAAESPLIGQYDDPNHPGCLRKITVKGDVVTIIGSDNIDGSKQWVLQAKEDAPGVMFVDFSPKGGPSDLLGVYNEKADGIKWPDGNMWMKIKSK